MNARVLQANLPSSPESEEAIIALLLAKGRESWDVVAGQVASEDFTQAAYAHIFSAIGQVQASGRPIDPITVAGAIPPKVLEGLGGADFLADLAFTASNTGGIDHLPAYIQTVAERSLLRRVMAAAQQIQEECAKANPGPDTARLLASAEQKIRAAVEGHQGGQRGFLPIKPLLLEVVDDIDKRFHADSAITGLKTPFADINEMTAGLQPDDLVIVAARPSMGKTAFALALTEEAMAQGVSVGFFSLEMSGKQLAMRMLSSRGRISAHNLRIGRIGDDDWPRLTATVAEMVEQETLFIDETPSLSVENMVARARRLQRDQEKRSAPRLGLIVVDYLQLLQSGAAGRRSQDNRATELSHITRSLKALAREIGAPVVALSQLNRGIEQRPSKRPVLSDLRESGSIEQDADTVMFLYRDEVYNPDTEDKGIAEVIIGKQRNGPTGVVRVSFEGRYTRFMNLGLEHDDVF